MSCVFNPRSTNSPLVFGVLPLSSLNFSIQRLLRAFTSFLHGYPLGILFFFAPFLGAFHTFESPIVYLGQEMAGFSVPYLCLENSHLSKSGSVNVWVFFSLVFCLLLAGRASCSA